MTKIEWTHAPGYRGESWNPVTGCTKLSPACARCYIERTPPFRMADRKFVRGRIPIQLHPERLEAPLRWQAPRMVFVCSISDLFHDEVPDSYIGRVFGTMAEAYRHRFLVLTKRTERMAEWSRGFAHYPRGDLRQRPVPGWPPNVWPGASVENQYWGNRRIPDLLQVKASVRFVSHEPLLRPVDPTRVDYGWLLNKVLEGFKQWREDVPFALRPEEVVAPGVAFLNVLTGEWHDGWDSGTEGPRLHWLLIGGESGPRPRPLDLDAVRHLRDQARAAGIPVFIKQLGTAWARENRSSDYKGANWMDWPRDLRVRDWPKPA